jgi:hypothetical protein
MALLYGRAGRLTAQIRRFPARAVMFENARTYNTTDSWVYADAEELENYVRQQVVGWQEREIAMYSVRTRAGRLSRLSVLHSRSVFYGAFCMGAQGA